MKLRCEICKKEFDDVNYDKFGSILAKRHWCNRCVRKEWNRVFGKKYLINIVDDINKKGKTFEFYSSMSLEEVTKQLRSLLER